MNKKREIILSFLSVLLIFLIIVLVGIYFNFIDNEENIDPQDIDNNFEEEIDDLFERPAHCSDGIYNEGEEGLDCGWTCPNECKFIEKVGELTEDETWEGNILVTGHTEIPEGVTLTILPGTIVKFKYSRDYRNPGRGNLYIDGGTIIAIGTPDERIWFTSSAPDPINGDWGGIDIHNSDDSIVNYVIVEFGEMGIEQFDSSTLITNSIIRWNNAEGLYAERSQPIFENNLLYGNGYHEIALEQYNDARILNNIFGSEDIEGHFGIITQKTDAIIEGNCIMNEIGGIFMEQESDIILRNNQFDNVQIPLLDNSNINEDDLQTNNFNGNNFECPLLNIEDIRNKKLDYTPGDIEDRFPYIYEEEDETRKVINKIGEGLGFGWTLEYVDDYLYKFGLGTGSEETGGAFVDLIKINFKTGEYERIKNDFLLNPRGLTHDGEYFYVNDFSLLKMFKFTIEDNQLNIINSFDIPEKELGGTAGLTTDKEFLYLRSRDCKKLYKLNKEGDLIDEISLNGCYDKALTWDGQYFWMAHGNMIRKLTKEGKLVGQIYQPAKETWGMTWDGNYLWTLQRTAELWNDPKIYQIEILDDSLS
tara:strand:+ start:64 stop:1833 length:1770 start_codon:yes stop_codon:yes gene_type:complete